MSIFGKWREARGMVMRGELGDALSRLRGANASAMNGFNNNLDQIVDESRRIYSSASESERKRFLKLAQQQAKSMWDNDMWPEALSVVIVCLYLESEFVPGDDAAFVRSETARLIEEAKQANSNV